MTPTIAAVAGGLVVAGFRDGPHHVYPGDADVLVHGSSYAELYAVRDDPAGEEDGLAYVVPVDGRLVVRVRPGLCLDQGVWQTDLDGVLAATVPRELEEVAA